MTKPTYQHIIGNRKLTDFEETKDAVITNYLKPIKKKNNKDIDNNTVLNEWR